MPKPRAEDRQPVQDEEFQRVIVETADRLRQRGVLLTGRESSDELVSLLDAVEEYELAVEQRGGDLMMDEAPEGETPQPDDVHFALPRRGDRESVADYLVRVLERTDMIRQHRSLET